MTSGTKKSVTKAELQVLKVSNSPEPRQQPASLDIDNRHDALNISVVGDIKVDDPVNWSGAYKWTIIILISLMTTVVNFAIFICAPATPQILRDFKSDNYLYTTLIVSIWELGETAGPLLIGPLSEVFGRRPVYHTANILFIMLSVANGFGVNIDMVVAFRFLTGLSVASLSLNPPIVGDMFVKDQRGKAMAIMGIAPLCGTAIGPIIGGYLSAALSWRWNFWLVAILAAGIEVILLVLLREPYKAIILQRNAKRLRREQGMSDLSMNSNRRFFMSNVFKTALLRPPRLLVRSPILLLTTLYVSYVYGTTYLVFTTLAEVFQGFYGFAQGPAGLVYLGIALGMAAGTLICGLTLDRFLRYKAAHGSAEPENRLFPMACGAILVPIGLLIYGWTAATRCHWIAPIIGTAVLSCGLAAGQISSSSYLVDVFGGYSASAIAASLVIRYLTSTLLPLAGPPLLASVGVGWTGTILSLISLVFMPLPFILIRYGKYMRSRYNVKL